MLFIKWNEWKRLRRPSPKPHSCYSKVKGEFFSSGHLHLVLIKPPLPRGRPDQRSLLRLFCPFANVSAPCSGEDPPRGGGKVEPSRHGHSLHVLKGSQREPAFIPRFSLIPPLEPGHRPERGENVVLVGPVEAQPSPLSTHASSPEFQRRLRSEIPGNLGTFSINT